MFLANNNNEKHLIEEVRKDHSMVSPVGEKRTTRPYTHAHAETRTYERTEQACAHGRRALQTSLAFGWLWHNGSTVKTSSRLTATLSFSVVTLAHRSRVFT